MMKLLIAGLAMIGLGLGLVVFTYYDPTLLFIFGVICSFIAVLHGSMPASDGRAVSGGTDLSAATDLYLDSERLSR
jgi:hypothetical protein